MKKGSPLSAAVGWLAIVALALLMALASPTCNINGAGVPPLWALLVSS